MQNKPDLLNTALRRSLFAFILKAFETVNSGRAFYDNWHLHALAWHLEQCRKGKIKRLIVNMPPRHLKSHCVTVSFPAFILGHDPTRRILCASYEAGLSKNFSRQSRQLIESKWFRGAFPNLKLSPKKNTEEEIVTTRNGYRYATSVGGPLTGKGANFLIIDDPMKASDAQSEAERKRVTDWFRESAFTRLDSKENDVIIVVAQRTHQDDLSGYLLRSGDWVHLNLPSIATEPTKIRIGDAEYHSRKLGEILHPDFEGEAALEEIKQQLGSYAFSAQYQQSPVAPEGNLLKRAWFRRYDERPSRDNFSRIIQSWDTATSVSEGASFSVCSTWGIIENRYYLIEVIRDRLEFPDLQRKIIRTAKRWGAEAVLIERASSGLALLQNLRKETASALIGIPVESDKQVRVSQVSSIIEAGRVYLPKDATWLAEFENEVLGFPSCKHDDQVDSLSQFLLWVIDRENRRPNVTVKVISVCGVRDRYYERMGVPALPGF